MSQRSIMENLTQDVEITQQGQETFDLLSNIKEEPSDHDNGSCQCVNGVISDQDTKTEFLDHKDITIESVDLSHGDMQVTLSSKGSGSNCLTVWKCEKNEVYVTNVTLENGTDRKDRISEVAGVKKEQSNNLFVSDSSYEDSHDLNGDETTELLTRTSECLAVKLMAVCEELKEEKEAEIDLALMESPNTLKCHTYRRANTSNSPIGQIMKRKLEPESGSEKSETFSCDMCHRAFPQHNCLLKHISKYHYEYSRQQHNLQTAEDKSFCRKKSNTSNSISSKSGMEVQKLETDNVNCVISASGENNLTGQCTGQQVLQHCIVSSIPDIKQFDSTPVLSNTFVTANNYSDSKSGQERDHLQLQGQKMEGTGEKLYKCNVCGMAFPQFRLLKMHKKMHTGEESYKCVDLVQASTLKSHKRIHTGKKSNKCDVRGRCFSSSSRLQAYKRTQTGEKPHKYDVCAAAFASKSRLQRHQRIHTGEKPYMCDVCGKGFASSNYLKTHKRIHTAEKPYKCGVCGKGFANGSNLQRHQRVHTGEKPFKCDDCGKGIASRGYLKTHKRKHTGEKPFKCDDCGKGFTHGDHLKTHKRKHTGEKPFMCGICGKGFHFARDLKTHKWIHTGEKPFKCDVCGKGIASRGYLKTHRRIHTGEKPYMCDVCGKGFAFRNPFQYHKSTHTGEKPFKCDVCGKGFPSGCYLKTHKNIHMKPFKCDVCDVGFALKSTLQSHKRIHTGEKPYKCDVCGKGLASSNYLQVHKRIHTGEKPYKCDVCGVGFPSSYYLKTHKRIHTEEKPYKCDVCGKGFTKGSSLKRHKKNAHKAEAF